MLNKYQYDFTRLSLSLMHLYHEDVETLEISITKPNIKTQELTRYHMILNNSVKNTT